ncbi:predicted protein [Botrytis cinerea T4]|uniref:Uncharacterized protein n=1 Tax=Botryotinia fuckeliana (strain T4) TaxID=999810 RepID=G2Y0B2_BOTF4|nr:predicted protein [Botrytis cinerea T4]
MHASAVSRIRHVSTGYHVSNPLPAPFTSISANSIPPNSWSSSITNSRFPFSTPPF